MSDQIFCILDPSLKDFRGHHFMLTDLASKSAEAAGMKVSWLVANTAAQDFNRPDVAVTPWFSTGMYDAYKDAHATPPLWQRLMRRGMSAFGAKPHDISLKVDPVKTLRADFLRAIDHVGDPGAARFLIHTADGATYRALALIVERLAANDAPIFHVCTPYDPAGVIPNRGPTGALTNALATLKDAGVIGRRLFLHAENPFLAEHLSALWGAPVSTLEIPVATNDDASDARYRYRKQLGVDDRVFVIASLGPARLEKGFDLFPEIIREYQSLITSGAYPALTLDSIRFALHAAPQIIGRHPDIQIAIDGLESIGADMVSVLKKPLSSADYAALLAASDAVIMPYDAQKYRVRGSGAVIEALASAKIIIATAGSYPARMIAPNAGISATTPLEFAHAICKAASERTLFQKHAAAAAADYAKRNSVINYVEKIIAAETAGLTAG